MRKLISFIILVNSLLACDSDETIETNVIDATIQITPMELLIPNANYIALSSKTDKLFPCENYKILTASSIGEENINITFFDVSETENCLTALGPAKNIFVLGELTNGEYKIGINNGSLKNNGLLKISNNEIVLDLESENGIEIVRKTTKRIPPNTYWGSVGFHTDSSLEKANEFLFELENMTGVKAFNKQIPGIYSYYEIKRNGEIVPDSLSGYNFVKYFIFQFNGEDDDKFNNEIDLLATSYHDDLSISFQNSKGDTIYIRD